MAWIFGSNPNQANNISKKKKPLFKESYNIKNMQLYHNIVKTGGVHFGGFSNHKHFFFMGLKKSPPFFTPHKKIILLTLFLI